jgi:hypothetical protein
MADCSISPLKQRYSFNFKNNGRIYLSIRIAAKETGLNKNTLIPVQAISLMSRSNWVSIKPSARSTLRGTTLLKRNSLDGLLAPHSITSSALTSSRVGYDRGLGSVEPNERKRRRGQCACESGKFGLNSIACLAQFTTQAFQVFDRD